MAQRSKAPAPRPAEGQSDVRKGVIQLIVLVLALLLLALPIAGVYVFLRSGSAGETTDAPIVLGEQPEGIEHMLLGLYLAVRDGDLRRPAGSNSTPVRFVVRPGETAEVIGRNLQGMGLITDAELFRQLVKYQGVGDSLQAGEYELRATMTMEEVVAALQHSRGREVRVTLREGWRLEQIANALAKSGLSTYEELMKVMRTAAFDYSILRDRPAGVSLEGYLYADTYLMDVRWSAEQIIALLVGTMEGRFTAAMRQKAAARGLTIHQVLTIASLVERETVLATERPIVASVYLNRLAKNMALEVDATVQYALGYDKAQQTWWPSITIMQLRAVESPYNTYLRRGLPPGPICSPGLASIQAILEPAKTDYLFYYAKGDGSHAFAKTFTEHLENQKKYQK